MKTNFNDIKPAEKFLAAMQILHMCTMCGRCCRGMDGLAQNSVDVLRMAKHLGMKKNDYAKEYTTPSHKKPTDRLIRQVNETKDCIFWSDKGCTQYEGRGQVCRLYPWTTPQNLEAVRAGKPWGLYGICKGMALTYERVLRESFSMPEEQANAIIESPLGNIIMLNTLTDLSHIETARFAAKELGLEDVPPKDRLKTMAFNYAVAYVAKSPVDERLENLRRVVKHLNSMDVNQ